jgi:hypothetical protein
MKKEKIKWLGLILMVLFFVSISFGVGAEDDDEEEDDEDDHYESSASSKSSSVAQATTTTSKSVETVILKDKDGDGILDKDDAHPDLAEIYIVEDGNKNGIVDKFEK